MIKLVEIQIPAETERVVIMVNCSIPSVNHSGQGRLGTEGVALAMGVRQQYIELFDWVKTTAVAIPSRTTCYTSEDLTAQQTFQIIFKDEPGATAKSELNQIAFLEKIQDGKWFKAQSAGQNLPKLIREAISQPKLQKGQPWEDGHVNYLEFLLFGNTVKSEVSLVVAHEPHISQAAINHLPLDQLGLNPCEAIIFFLKNHKGVSDIVGAVKFVPQ